MHIQIPAGKLKAFSHKFYEIPVFRNTETVSSLSFVKARILNGEMIEQL